MNCSIKGCDKKARCRQLCSSHYKKWLKHKDPLHVSNNVGRPAVPSKECVIDGCDGKIIAKGLCNIHYRRDMEHQDVCVNYVEPLKNQHKYELPVALVPRISVDEQLFLGSCIDTRLNNDINFNALKYYE